jgi:hypothetical protein
MGTYIEHTSVESQDFRIVDATTENALGDTLHLIWVGFYGEGRWLTADEAEQLAGAVFGVAAIHRARRGAEVPA